MMKRMRPRAIGFKILTRNLETLGAHLEMAKPMERGMTRKKA